MDKFVITIFDNNNDFVKEIKANSFQIYCDGKEYVNIIDNKKYNNTYIRVERNHHVYVEEYKLTTNLGARVSWLKYFYYEGRCLR